ncbi:FANCF protein, partial [Trogon melanurus]|nr:FANCF protein [Trogon melanurus]
GSANRVTNPPSRPVRIGCGFRREAGLLLKAVAPRGRLPAMEAVLAQVEQLPALLAVSRSALVRDWDSLTLDRALEWGRYFQHLHDRFHTRPRLREAFSRRLRRGQPSLLLGFPHLGRCPQLLGLALLENRALRPAACRRLIHSLLHPPGSEAGPEPHGLALLARRKAASRLMALPGYPPRPAEGLEPLLQAEAQLLLNRLREEGREAEPAGGAAERLHWLCGVLEQLRQPRTFEVVAAALLLLRQGGGAEQAGGGGRDGSSLDGNQASATEDECVAGLLLSWLLGDLERFSAFCLSLPGSLLASLAGHYCQLNRPYLDLLTRWGSQLLYDPLQGQWVKSCLDKTELSWEELRERFSCLCQGSALLRGQTQAALKLLKARDGDFNVCGISVWTDLLVEIEECLRKE